MSYLKKRKKVIQLEKPVNILRDDREKKPWRINSPDFTVSKCRLSVGDYTIEGFEKTVAIEKKSGLKEFIMNLSGRDRKRFERELVKLAEFPIKCIVIEDTLDARLYRLFKTINTRIYPFSVYFWINKIIVQYGIPVLFIGRNPGIRRQMIIHLFEWVVKEIEYGTK